MLSYSQARGEPAGASRAEPSAREAGGGDAARLSGGAAETQSPRAAEGAGQQPAHPSALAEADGDAGTTGKPTTDAEAGSQQAALFPPPTPPPANGPRPGSAARRRDGPAPPPPPLDLPGARNPGSRPPSAAAPLSPPPASIQPRGSSPECLLPAPQVFAVLPAEAQELLLRSERARLAALPRGPTADEQRTLHEAAEILARAAAAAGGDGAAHWAGSASAGADFFPVTPWSAATGPNASWNGFQRPPGRPGSAAPSPRLLSPSASRRGSPARGLPEASDPHRHPGRLKCAAIYGNNPLARFPPERLPPGDPRWAGSRPATAAGSLPRGGAGAITLASAKRRALSAGTRKGGRARGEDEARFCSMHDPSTTSRLSRGRPAHSSPRPSTPHPLQAFYGGFDSTGGSRQGDPSAPAGSPRAENLLRPFQSAGTRFAQSGDWAEPPAAFQLAGIRDPLQRPRSAIPAARLDKIRRRSDQMRTQPRSGGAPDPWTLQPNTLEEPQKVFFSGNLSRAEINRRRAVRAPLFALRPATAAAAAAPDSI